MKHAAALEKEANRALRSIQRSTHGNVLGCDSIITGVIENKLNTVIVLNLAEIFENTHCLYLPSYLNLDLIVVAQGGPSSEPEK